MRIISKFKDYYDSARGFGYDPSLVYVRHTETLEFSEEASTLSSSFNKARVLLATMPSWHYYFRRVLLCFCGQAYPVYMFQDYYGKPDKPLYSYWDIVEFSKTEGLKPPPKKAEYAIPSLDEVSWKAYIDKDFSLSSAPFRELDCPVFSLAYRGRDSYLELVKNPLLKPYRFASVKPPYQAFQELAVYLGNDMVKQEDPSEKFSDELKRDAHGFDNWSFKKKGC